MAEYDERSSEDLTEEPTQHRLDEMREKGQVAYSRELTSGAVFAGGVLVMAAFGASYFKTFGDFMRDLFKNGLLRSAAMDSPTAAAEVFRQAAKLGAVALLPFFIAIFAVAIGVSVAQTQGFLFATESIKINFTHLNPVSGFKKLFSAQNLFQGVKSVVKFCAIVAVMWSTVKGELPRVPDLAGFTMGQVGAYVGTLTLRVCFALCGLMVVLSAVDYGFQWWNHRKQARMTKEEAKREMKEREGDPQVKARMKSVQRDMARKRMMKSVPKADVIVTNPTHIAVAIVYEKELLAPKVLAKGGDFMAERIKEIARQHGIPIVENKPLARALYKNVKVGQMIPRAFYQAVAEILAYVYRIKPKEIFAHQDGGPGQPGRN